jgi:uncharacterized protein (TIGR00369 family)
MGHGSQRLRIAELDPLGRFHRPLGLSSSLRLLGLGFLGRTTRHIERLLSKHIFCQHPTDIVCAIGLDFPNYDDSLAQTIVARAGGSSGEGVGGLPAYLQIRATSVGPGRLVCELPVTEELLNPFGAAHGGVVSALVDHVLGAVCMPVIERGAWPATLEYKLNFLAPARVGTMVAEASIVSMSRRTAVVRVDVSNDGRPICVAQGAVAIMAPRPGA